MKKQKYFIHHIPSIEPDHYFEAEIIDPDFDQEEILEHVMSLPDGDLGNYEIYELMLKSGLSINTQSKHPLNINHIRDTHHRIIICGQSSIGRSIDHLLLEKGFEYRPPIIHFSDDLAAIGNERLGILGLANQIDRDLKLERPSCEQLVFNDNSKPPKKRLKNNRKHVKRRKK